MRLIKLSVEPEVRVAHLNLRIFELFLGLARSWMLLGRLLLPLIRIIA